MTLLLNLRAFAFATLAVAAVCFTGCPSPEPKRPAKEAPSASEAKDDEKAIAALKEKGATLNLDKAGNVGEVILPAECTNNDLKHVAALPHCKRIRAPQTKFDNECLAAIAGMQQLVALDLTGCDVISADGTPHLAGLTNLELLKLQGPEIDDSSLATIGKLSKLKVLRVLQSNKITSDGIQHLAGHATLKELNLYGCRELDNAALESLGKIPNLEILGLRGTKVRNEGLKFLASLTKLKELDLSETDVGGGEDFTALAAIQSLVDLNVWKTNCVDADMPAIGQLKNLKRLNLDNTKVTDAGLESVQGLADLEYIHLGKTMITDKGLALLHGLKKLKTVIVTVVPGVSEDGAAELQKAIPGVDVKR